MNETERILKEHHENEKRIEKKQLLRRRLKGFKDTKDPPSVNLQSITSYLAPTPVAGHSRTIHD